MTSRIYGHTKSGEPIDDAMVERFVEEAERGYTADQLRNHRRGLGLPSEPDSD